MDHGSAPFAEAPPLTQALAKKRQRVVQPRDLTCKFRFFNFMVGYIYHCITCAYIYIYIQCQPWIGKPLGAYIYTYL